MGVHRAGAAGLGLGGGADRRGVVAARPDCAVVLSEGINTAAQALAYEALFSTFYPQPWFGGFYMWLWRSDPTTGGLSDDSFGPQGKPETMAVLGKWWK